MQVEIKCNDAKSTFLFQPHRGNVKVNAASFPFAKFFFRLHNQKRAKTQFQNICHLISEKKKKHPLSQKRKCFL